MISFYIFSTAPSNPKELTVSQDDDYIITLSWKPPNESVDEYRIEYRKGNQPFQELPIKAITNLNFTISPESGYTYRVVDICAKRGHPTLNHSKLIICISYVILLLLQSTNKF